jgi:hypothetical protein
MVYCPHFHCNMTQFLNSHLPGRCSGRGGPTVWPPTSLDLTTIDFFYGGCVRLSTPHKYFKISMNSKFTSELLVNKLRCKCCPVIEWDWLLLWHVESPITLKSGGIKTLRVLVYAIQILLLCIAYFF